MKHTYYLSTRLVAWIGIPIMLAVMLTLLLSYHYAREEIEEVYDAQLVHSAKVLFQLTQHELTEDENFNLGIEPPNLQHRYERNLGFRIWRGGELVTNSPSTDGFKGIETPPGFSNRVIGNHEWRFYVYIDAVRNIKIEVSERYDIRYELIIQLMSSVSMPVLFFIPVILLIVWIGVRKVLKPVVKLSADVDQRGSNDLSPIVNEKVPREIAPLIQAINDLFTRLEDSFKREREFTDHAAHELRTPLAAMKTQSQVLAKKVKGMPECAQGLENLHASINRAAHLVEQLLSLARLQHESLPLAQVDCGAHLNDVINDLSSYAEKKNIKLHVRIDEHCLISANEDSIGILLHNLLDNAIKYTPENGRIDISLNEDGVLEIADSGPGLTQEEKNRVFERFVRVDKSGQIGSGLGLSIAKWIADAHNVDIELYDNHPTGLKMVIKWAVFS